MRLLESQKNSSINRLMLGGLIISGEANNLEDVEEEVDDVQVEVEGSEHILLRGQGVLKNKDQHSLGI